MNLSLQDTFADSPKYKIIITQAEQDLDGVFNWLDVTAKALKNYSHSLHQQVSAQRHLSKHLQPQQVLLDKLPLTTLNDSLQCSIPFTSKFVDDVEEIVQSIHDFKITSEFKEQRRLFNKCEAAYDSYLKWFLSLSKAKEASSVREDAFQLHDVRVSYIKQSFKYSQYLIGLKYELDQLCYRCLSLVSQLQEYYDNLQTVNKGFMSKVSLLQGQFKAVMSERKEELQNLEIERESLEEQMIEQHQPSTQLPISTVQKPEVTAELKDKSGYLMRRTHKGVWLRRYAQISQGCLVLSAVQGYKIGKSAPLNLSICQVKVSDAHDRRFVFEVVSHNNSLVLQAEDEDEFLEWMKVIEASRLHGNFEEQDFSGSDGLDEEFPQFEDVSLLKDLRAVQTSSQDNFKFPSMLHKKKNLEFHNIVKSIPDDEYLMESYAAQYQDKEELIQGRLYLTRKNVCFNSLLQSGITTILIPVSQISKVKVDQALRLTVLHQEVSLVHSFFVPNLEFVQGALDLIRASKLSQQDLVNVIHEKFQLPEERRQSSPTLMVQSTSWPSEAPAPPDKEIQCGCQDHNEKEELNLVLKVPAHVLFDKLFMQTSIFENTRKKRSEWDIKFTDWQEVDGHKQRSVSWMFHVNQAMVSVKETDCQEVQVVTKNDPYLCYVVDVSSKTLNLPYGDTFQTETRYCITYVSAQSCRLRCTVGLTWFKSPFVKNIIKNAAIAGLAGFLKDLMPVLQSEIGYTAVESVEPTPSLPARRTSVVPVDLPWTTIAGAMSLVVAVLAYFLLLPTKPVTLSWVQDPSVKGVYYEEVYSQLLNNSQLRSIVQRDTFKYFLQSDSHVYHSAQFEKEASSLGKTQKYTQRLRKQLLVSLETVNDMEVQLIRRQYVYWLKDNISRCLSLLKLSDQEELKKACRSLQFDLKSFLVAK